MNSSLLPIPKTSRPPLSRRKKWLFRAALLLALVPILELVSWCGLWWTEPQFSLSQLHKTQDQLAATGSTSKDRSEVLHPYMGWILNPQTHPEIFVGDRMLPVNVLGFADDGPSLYKKSPERFIVGITGGSVAQHLSVMGAETLRRKLSASPRLKGAKVEIVRMAFSGFKQPQQLMTLAYLLSLGGQFDAVVNFDGFNEIALPSCENDRANTFAAYPRAWRTLTASVVDPRDYVPSFRLLELRAKRQEAARAIASSPIRFLPTRNLFWKIADAYREGQIAALGEEILAEKGSQGRGFVASGPNQRYHGEQAMFQDLAGLWRDSSLQMHALCRGNGISYVHVLQPNQYVAGSKPMGSDERRDTIDPQHCYGISVGKAYSLLIHEGEKLRTSGVRFHDFTRMFAKVDEPLYCDKCCHLNQRGNDLMAAAVADAVLESMEPKASVP